MSIPYSKAVKASRGTRDRFSLRGLEPHGPGPLRIPQEVTPALSACEGCRMGVAEAAEGSGMYSLASFTLGTG